MFLGPKSKTSRQVPTMMRIRTKANDKKTNTCVLFVVFEMRLLLVSHFIPLTVDVKLKALAIFEIILSMSSGVH